MLTRYTYGVDVIHLRALISCITLWGISISHRAFITKALSAWSYNAVCLDILQAHGMWCCSGHVFGDIGLHLQGLYQAWTPTQNTASDAEITAMEGQALSLPQATQARMVT